MQKSFCYATTSEMFEESQISELEGLEKIEVFKLVDKAQSIYRTLC